MKVLVVSPKPSSGVCDIVEYCNRNAIKINVDYNDLCTECEIYLMDNGLSEYLGSSLPSLKHRLGV